MSAEHTDSDFNELAAKNYNKLSEKTFKSGYKDGMNDGRESMFQAGFDDGYKEGFKNAFVIGKYNGLATASLRNKDEDVLLKKSTRGQCLICTDKTLLGKGVSEIISIQSNHAANVNKILEELYTS